MDFLKEFPADIPEINQHEVLIKIPNHLSYEQAASLVCTGTTTWNALHGKNPLLPGQTVLFQGTGGVSLTGLMLAKVGGCTTILTSSFDEKLKEKYGVDYTINYKTQPNSDEEALKITNGQGVESSLALASWELIQTGESRRYFVNSR